jgi:hypothetical protein
VKQLSRAFAVLALCFALFAPTAFAQVQAVLGGIVTDSSGAVMPMVTVSAKNNSTGIVTNGTTNASGAYEFPALQPGTYTVTATNAGFRTQAYNDVALGQNQQVRLNFTMAVATAGETVEVIAQADTALATTSSSVGGVLNTRDLESLPVASRNVLDLVALMPGVVLIPGAFAPTVANFMGTQVQDINTTRDGMVSSDGRYNSSNGAYSATFTSADMVEEMRVSTNTIDPALGRGSAQVQMRTRGGGNAFHGALFYTNVNSKLESNNYFSNLTGQKLSYENRNQFGGRIGGPIKKNKLFFLLPERRSALPDKGECGIGGSHRAGPSGHLPISHGGRTGGTTRRNGNAFSTTPSVDLSSVAVDPIRDEVVLQDTNIFGIKIFNRTDNTPPSSESTTPKRVIQGDATRCEYNAGLSIDSRTGEIYSVAMDTEDNVIVFGSGASGNIAPIRILKTPHRNFASGIDDEKEELYVTIQYPPKWWFKRRELREPISRFACWRVRTHTFTTRTAWLWTLNGS